MEATVKTMSTTESTLVRGAGKKATINKRKLYANPLPIGRAAQSGPNRGWWDWLISATSFLHAPSSNPAYHGWYDSQTASVWMHVTGEAMTLWTHGFFGKGNLSRSEPTWMIRRQAEVNARARGELTAEQLTQQRREERKLLKIERARAAVQAGIQLPDGIAALGGQVEDTPESLWKGDEDAPQIQAGVARIKGLKYFGDAIKKEEHYGDEDELDDVGDDMLPHIEHFQLTLQEAFFLSAMLGCLEVRDYDENVSQYLPDFVSHRALPQLSALVASCVQTH